MWAAPSCRAGGESCRRCEGQQGRQVWPLHQEMAGSWRSLQERAHYLLGALDLDRKGGQELPREGVGRPSPPHSAFPSLHTPSLV